MFHWRTSIEFFSYSLNCCSCFKIFYFMLNHLNYTLYSLCDHFNIWNFVGPIPQTVGYLFSWYFSSVFEILVWPFVKSESILKQTLRFSNPPADMYIATNSQKINISFNQISIWSLLLPLIYSGRAVAIYLLFIECLFSGGLITW